MARVHTDSGTFRIPMLGVEYPSLARSIISTEAVLPNVVKDLNFDLVTVTPYAPFHLVYPLARKKGIPLILRIWGIRAAIVFDFIANSGNYLEISRFLPNLIHNLIQVGLSRSVVTMDCYTSRFLHIISPLKASSLIYPTYAALYKEPLAFQNQEVAEKFAKDGYIFSIVSLGRTGALFNLQERLLLKILISIAKRNPQIPVVIVGGTTAEARGKLGISILPKNLYLVGRVFDDSVLRMLYLGARLVVIPVFFRSLSNRLLEALYYGRPILTNSTAQTLYAEVSHMDHLFISDNYTEYPKIVSELFKDEHSLETLERGAKEAYRSLFSTTRCGLAMEKVIQALAQS